MQRQSILLVKCFSILNYPGRVILKVFSNKFLTLSTGFTAVIMAALVIVLVNISTAATINKSKYGRLLMTVQKVSPSRLQIAPGEKSAAVQLSGMGLDRIKNVRVSVKQGKTLIAAQGASARIASLQPGAATIVIDVAQGAMKGNALLEMELHGIGGTVALPGNMLGIGIVSPAGQAGLQNVSMTAAQVAGSGRQTGTQALAGSLSAQSGSGSGLKVTPPGTGTSPGSKTGAGTGSNDSTQSSLTGNTGANAAQNLRSSMSSGTWSGNTTMTDSQTSGTGKGESQEVHVVEYYSSDDGTKTTITTDHVNGHTYQSVLAVDKNGNKQESNSIDGQEVSGSGDNNSGGGGEGESGGTQKDESGDAKKDSASNALEPSGTSSFPVPKKTIPASKPDKGNVDPAQDASGKQSTGSVATTVRQSDVKRGLGDDTLNPGGTQKSNTRILPAKVPNKGNIDPNPEKP
ncbi:MAG: hypothetical protein ABFD75_04990 [Smithella sp.]